MYKVGSLTAAARELARYKLDLVGVQEVRWGMVRAGDYKFSMIKGNKNYQSGTGNFVHYRIVSAVKTVGFVRDRVSYLCSERACTK